MNENMDGPINSDNTMAASKKFDYILHQIQHSSLNFQIQVSPFSAVISLKKTFIRDKSGVILPNSYTDDITPYPSEAVPHDTAKLSSLENEVADMHEKFAKLKLKYSAACENLVVLENELKDRDEKIKTLEAANNSAVAAANKLNKALVEQKQLYDKDKNHLINE